MYFDPGSGSMIIQLIIAAIAAGGATLLAFKNKIKLFIRRHRSKTKNEDISKENEEE